MSPPVLTPPDDEERERTFFRGDTPQGTYDDEFERMRASGGMDVDSELAENNGPDKDEKSFGSDQLKSSEENPGQSKQNIGDKESAFANTLQNQIGGGFGGAAASVTPQGRAAKAALMAIKLFGSKKKAGAAGGVVGLIVFIGILFGSLGAFELIHLREEVLGRFNRPANFVLARRRGKSLTRMARKINDGRITTVDAQKFQTKFRKQGFVVDLTNDGKIARFGFPDADGNIRNYDFSKPTRQAADEFFDGDLGKTIGRKVDETLPGVHATWRGSRIRSFYDAAKLRPFWNWLGRETNPAATDKRAKIADQVRHWDDANNRPDLRARVSGDTDPRADDDTINPTDDVSDNSDFTDGAAEEEERARNNPTERGAGNLNINERSTLNDIGGALEGGADGDSLQRIIRDAAGSLGTDAAAAVSTRAAGGAVRGLSITDWYAQACRIKGTLAFVGQIRNVFLAAAVAKLSIKFLTAADHQKAGVLGAGGADLLLTYMHTQNPKNGRSFWNSGGMRWRGGDSTARVNPENLSELSLSRQNGGLLSSMSAWLERNTGQFLSPTGCRIANNGFVQIAGAAIGLIVAIVPTGAGQGFTAGKVALAIGLSVLGELAYQVGKAVAIKSVTGMVIDGYEDGEFVGDAFAAGIGAMFLQGGGVNGLLPTTKPELSLIQEEAEQNHKEYLADLSIKDRYFNIDNHSSFASTAMMNLATTKSTFSPKSLLSMGWLSSGLNNLAGTGLAAASLGGGRVLAQEENDQCNDEQVAALNLAADPFCSPMFATTHDGDTDQIEEDLRTNGMIDQDGSPTANYDEDDDPNDYEDYLARCHGGNTLVIYNEVGEDGNTEPVGEDSDVCVNGTAEQRTWTHYYGYWVDEQNMIEDINDSYETGSSGQPIGAGDGGLGISPDGFTFPLRTNQDAIINDPAAIEAYGGPWCYDRQTNCHHDYNAADIFVTTGTAVVAARGGSVVVSRDNDDSRVGSRVQIMGDDGVLYYYAHMGEGTILVNVGDTVTAGQEIGKVGTNADAVGTVRHLHFDALPGDQYSTRPSCSGASCSDKGFILVQPALVQSFGGLPANGSSTPQGGGGGTTRLL